MGEAGCPARWNGLGSGVVLIPAVHTVIDENQKTLRL